MLQEENYQNHKIFETFAEKNFLDPRQIIKELLTKGEGKAISEWEEPEKKKYGYILSYIEDLDTDFKNFRLQNFFWITDPWKKSEKKENGISYGRVSEFRNFITDGNMIT